MDAIKDTILGTIIARKYQEVIERKKKIALKDIEEIAAEANEANAARGFEKALIDKKTQGMAGVIAEIKKASPSQGIIRQNFHPSQIAQQYQKAGAACLSILTDHDFFGGSEDYLKEGRAACNLPVLRKDFMVDPYHIIESRAIGADAILLIAACLSDMQLNELYSVAQQYGLDILIEVHNRAELERVLPLESKLIGINNRNLKDFSVSLDNTIALLPLIPSNRIVITESGIKTPSDVVLMQAHGVNHFLVGESFMRQDDVEQAFKDLFT